MKRAYERRITHENTEADFHITEIKNAYRKIDEDWLQVHYHISVGLVLFTWAMECILGYFIIHTDLMNTSLSGFLRHYIMAPIGATFILGAISRVFMKTERIKLEQKIYAVSLILVSICFVLFTVHSVFPSMYFIFAIPILLTAIYANYRLTIVTAASSLLSMVFSELFLFWDRDKIGVFTSTLTFSNFLIAIFVLLALSIVCMAVVRYEKKKNEASIQMEMERYQLQQSLQRDELTGLYNRKAMMDALKEIEEEETVKNGVIAMVDLDHFKGLNDTWGHALGDRCLVEFAGILKENAVNYTSFRFGGDEFCMVFHNTEIEAAWNTCEQIRNRVSELFFEDLPMVRLTASFGLANYENTFDASKLFAQSDLALYKAKEKRNTIHVFQKNKR